MRLLRLLRHRAPAPVILAEMRLMLRRVHRRLRMEVRYEFEF
jgi:hypothetical protein